MAKRHRDQDPAANRLAREATSVTITYERKSDGCVAVLVGEGASFVQRIADADSQLPPGTWLRQCVSTPASIYIDLQGRSVNLAPFAYYAFARYEGKVVHV